MINLENSPGRNHPELGFDALRKTDLGVICIFTLADASEEKYVLMTVDKEDIEKKKSEKLKEMIQMVLIGSEMLTFPGGKVEAGEKTVEAVLREIKEETGLTIEKSRLYELNSEAFEVEQERGSENNSSTITNFFVFGFTYQISPEELHEMRTLLATQGRQVLVMTQQEVAQLSDFEIRPSSKGLLKVAQLQQ